MQLTNNNDDPFLHIAFSGVQIFTSVPSSATSDPHLIGATGSDYEFDSEPGGTYTLFQRHNFKWSCTWPGMGRALVVADGQLHVTGNDADLLVAAIVPHPRAMSHPPLFGAHHTTPRTGVLAWRRARPLIGRAGGRAGRQAHLDRAHGFDNMGALACT